jgi:hypothetical protein
MGFAALGDKDADLEINSAWRTNTENVKTSARGSLRYYEMKQHKPLFAEGCS